VEAFTASIGLSEISSEFVRKYLFYQKDPLHPLGRYELADIIQTDWGFQ